MTLGARVAGGFLGNQSPAVEGQRRTRKNPAKKKIQRSPQEDAAVEPARAVAETDGGCCFFTGAVWAMGRKAGLISTTGSS